MSDFGSARGSEPSGPPNVLFFFTDDQRFDTIAALGNEDIITPNLDALVAGGTTFTHAHIMGGSCGAVCMPSRAMLMSGRTLFHIDEQGQNIPAEHVMMPEAFRTAGYPTFGTGKWHNGTQAYARAFSHGAKIFFGGMNDHWNVPVAEFDPTGEYPKERRCCRRGRHSSDLFSDEAVRFLLDYKDDRPFFMYVSYMAPHDPRETHKRFHDMYDPEKIPLPQSFMSGHPFDNGELVIRDEKLAGFPRTPEEIRRHIAEYYAMITHADAAIGRVLLVLKESGHADNTIVVFAGDNGLAVGRHGLMGKQNLYDHSVRVPLIFSGPGIPEGRKSEAFCYLLDIFPTLCDLTGVGIPESVEGRSLVPAMRDGDERIRETLLFAYKWIHRGVRDERYKLIEYLVNGKRTTQLFDLQEDPNELRNLADDAGLSGMLGHLRGELVRWRDELGDSDEFWRGYDENA